MNHAEPNKEATDPTHGEPSNLSRQPSRARLTIECLALFGGLPLLFLLGVLPMRGLMPTIVLGGLLTAWITPRLPAPPPTLTPHTWRWWHGAAMLAQIKQLLIGFTAGAAAVAVVMAAILWLQARGLLSLPEQIQWFALPRKNTVLWLAIMCLYPLISVYPQELIYRGFFCRRYAPIFRARASMITANALAFGWGHILFQNAAAVILTTIGGALFCATYLRRGSLGAAWLEHALYGCWVFTVGMGWWFYGGSVPTE